tara:strand:+ start:34 stop:150 length:117 start_codon:yes stop_codon:yes gene_type:complete
MEEMQMEMILVLVLNLILVIQEIVIGYMVPSHRIGVVI